jgi:hypothetical protein
MASWCDAGIRVANSPAVDCSGGGRYRRGLRQAWLLGFGEARWKFYTEEKLI